MNGWKRDSQLTWFLWLNGEIIEIISIRPRYDGRYYEWSEDRFYCKYCQLPTSVCTCCEVKIDAIVKSIVSASFLSVSGAFRHVNFLLKKYPHGFFEGTRKLFEEGDKEMVIFS